MVSSVFVNLPSSDLDRARNFYTALGASINPNFSDDNAICVVWNDTVYFMVLRRDYLQTFTEKPIIDTAEQAQALVALSVESRDAVDALLGSGVAAGGSEPKEASDLGFMYSRMLEDPDGNILEFLWMDPAAAQEGPPEAE